LGGGGGTAEGDFGQGSSVSVPHVLPQHQVSFAQY